MVRTRANLSVGSVVENPEANGAGVERVYAARPRTLRAPHMAVSLSAIESAPDHRPVP
jgi:hypothetical protein